MMYKRVQKCPKRSNKAPKVQKTISKNVLFGQKLKPEKYGLWGRPPPPLWKKSILWVFFFCEGFPYWPKKKLLGILSNMVPKSSEEGSLFVCAHFCPLKRKLMNIFMGRLVHILKCFHTFFIWQIQETPCIGYLLGSSISEKTQIWCIEISYSLFKNMRGFGRSRFLDCFSYKIYYNVGNSISYYSAVSSRTTNT